MRFDSQDHAAHQDFLTPHALFTDRKRHINWAAMLRPTGLAVYMAILSHAGYQSRTCYPSENTLARETGMDLRQVKREIKKLINFGMISKTTPTQKLDLFDIPDREKFTNTYTILDSSRWSIPKNYAPPEARADKGIRRKKSAQIASLPSDCESPDPVTVSHYPGDCESPDMVTVSHRPGDCESLGGGLSVTQNNRRECNHIEVTPSTSTTTAAAISEKTDNDVVDDVAAINSIFQAFKRQERLTPPLLAQIMKIHALESPAEVLLAVRALAPQAHIRSVIAVLKGKRTPDGYESGCFDGGKCYLYAPDDAPTPTRPQPNEPDAAPRLTAAELRERIAAMDAATRERVRRKVEARLESHRAKMKPDAYADTLQIAMQTEFEELVANGAD